MRNTRARKISKQLSEKNPYLLFALRNKLGSKTEKMGGSQLYRNAKKLWYECGKKKNWGITNLNKNI